MKKQYVQNICIIDTVEKLSDSVGKQDYVTVLSCISVLMSQLPKSLQFLLTNAEYFREAGVVVTQDSIVGMLSGLLQAQENEDYILYCDLLKLQVLPFFVEIQNAIRNQEGFFYDTTLYNRNLQALKEKNKKLYNQISDGDNLHESSVYRDSIYGVEYTTIGAFTLAIEENGKRYYIHSNDNPYREARLFADVYFDVKQERYLGFGLGLGYEWAELLRRNPDMELVICEPDIGVLQLAFTYMDMSWYLNSENVVICYDPEYATYLQKMDNITDVKLVLLRAYLKHIKEPAIKGKMEECLVRENSIRLYQDAFYINSKQNFKYCQEYVDTIHLQGKRVVLIAGGPSLDKNVHLLKDKPENTIYIAVGTVFRKMLHLEIPVDYVIITDPKEAVYVQVQGLEGEKTPILLLSTAYGKISKQYRGKKYLICQKDYERAEQYARQHGYQLYSTGGSVITTALDVAIVQEASEIICVGLDLAFTDNKDHASDVNKDKNIVAEGRLSVPAAGGGMVETIRPLVMYKKWIEKRILQQDVIMPIFDATEGGALIEGMQLVKLEDVL